MQDDAQIEYAGFWIRLAAMVIDTVLLLLITVPVLYLVYGVAYFDSDAFVFGWVDFVLSYLLPIVGTLVFWHYRAATPGKILLNLTIVDAETLQKPSPKQFVWRYLAYIVSMIPLFLGYIWVAFDPKKQAMHDKLTKTLVIKT